MLNQPIREQIRARMSQPEAPAIKPQALERYGSVRSAVIALHKQGMAPSHIARRLRCDVSYCRAIVSATYPDGKMVNAHSCKPTMGYPSRKAAIEAHYDKGMRPVDIARMLGISQSYVASVLSQIGATKRNLPDSVTIDTLHMNALRAQAVKRGLNPKQLCQRLIKVIAEDASLVDAVLDDGE